MLKIIQAMNVMMKKKEKDNEPIVNQFKIQILLEITTKIPHKMPKILMSGSVILSFSRPLIDSQALPVVYATYK